MYTALLTRTQRTHGNQILFSVNEIGRKPPLFAEASYVAQVWNLCAWDDAVCMCVRVCAAWSHATQHVLKSGFDFNFGKILYNHYKYVLY
jgi:hypothetical protein